MKRVLVTGGAGFIGSNLVDRLSHEGYSIIVIDNLSKQIHGEDPDLSSTYKSIKGKCEFIKGDCTDINVYKNLGHFNKIVFLVSETGTGQSMYESMKYCHTNVMSLAALNDAIINKSVTTDCILLSSSRAIYGDAKIVSGGPASSIESDIPCPLSIYASTKLAQEHLLKSGFNGVDNKVILRFQNVYGVGQSLSNPYTGILSIFSTAMLNGKDISVFEDGLMTRDFVYIDDVVSAICMGLENKEMRNDTFNVGSGVKTTILDIANILRDNLNSNSKLIITGERRVGDIRHNFANMEKIRRVGFVPTVDIRSGLAIFTDWVKTQKIPKTEYESSLDELRNKNLLIKD